MTIRCVVMDIEGTILPITFVRETLFPYAHHHLDRFLADHRDDGDVRRWLLLCQDTVAQEEGVRPTENQLPDILRRWMTQDRKHTGLKGLQGLIWEEGYRNGAFAPELYDDVTDTLSAWHVGGLQLALYSSGSAQAQHLLLTHTTTGDLTSLFAHYFDTEIGLKADAASYRRIAEQLALPPGTILFLSDIEAELDAATMAGFQAMQIVRPGTKAGTRHPIAARFTDIDLTRVGSANTWPAPR
ncbi:acireductone synthase [Nitrospira lenta]|uniref:Enolase-phosphatase E1 n=1 Tax=Nitrospira lenta TaxID=1436998 RepID=A0A330L0D5_9BACT|nr:acireductone synthase [Nitrospira lenta]SPP63225.1 Enolase-phosphatase E1 [Nitrospira lenta]